MPEQLTDPEWEFLLKRIRNHVCTPFIGPDAYKEIVPVGPNEPREFLPMSSRIVQKWRQHPGFPFDTSSLSVAAQVLSVLSVDVVETKDDFIDMVKDLPPPDFTNRDEPHRVLADLPFPVYITTNYDDFMIRALAKRGNKKPKRELCRWNKYILSDEPPLFPGFVPSVAEPVVFHLYGYTHVDSGMTKTPVPASLVLTEDDYLDFLVNTSRDVSIIPSRIQKTFTNTTLLLLGYRLDDWSFRVLFRSIVSYLNVNPGDLHVAVQLVPSGEQTLEEQKQKAQAYFDRYLGRNKIRAHWGSCHEFVSLLRQRWEDGHYGD
jgi:hypothetical protein